MDKLNQKQKKWIKEGRGSGELSNYLPWIKVTDVSSTGRSHRIFGHKTKRTHHLLSDLELYVFLLLEWADEVRDIKEQYPLKPEETIEISENISIRHPKINHQTHIMTSDFYVLTKNGDYALQAKYSESLDDKRTLEKLELERRYWQKKEVPWFIITEKDIPPSIKKNTEWLNPYMSYEMTNIVDKVFFYESQFVKNENRTIIELSKFLDRDFQLENGSSLAEIRALLATRFFKFDITQDVQKLTCDSISIADKTDIESIAKEYPYAVGQ